MRKYFLLVLCSFLSIFAFQILLFSQVNINSLGSPYTQNFNTLSDTGVTNIWTDNSTITGWYADLITYRADDGNSLTGAMYSYGAAFSTERAFGAISSNTTPTVRLGLRILNNTGSTIGLFQISYVGEQWRRNIFAQRLTFEYQVGATSLTSGTWTAVPAFDFNAPNSGAAAALDGNNATNRTSVSGSLVVTVTPGQEIWLRWTKTGTNSPGLAIDDFQITGQSPPAITDYYSKSTGDLDSLGTWGINTDGSGTSPSDFTSDNQRFNISNNTTPTIAGDWTVSGTNSVVVLGDTSYAINFTVPASYAFTGNINLLSNGTITLQNTTLPTFDQISAASTVVYDQSGTYTLPSTPAIYGNLKLVGGTKEFAIGFYTVGGDLILDGVSNFCGGATSPYTWIYLSKDYILQNGTTYNTEKANRPNLFCIGTNAQILKGNGIDIEVYRFVVDNISGVSLSETGGTSNLFLAGGYSLANGNLSVGANTITFDSSVSYISSGVNGTLTVSTSSNLIFNHIGGSGGLGTLILTPSFNSLNNFTMNATGVNPKMTIGSDITIGGTLTVTEGCLSIAGALTNNGTVNINDTIRLNDGAMVSGNAFNYGTVGTLFFNDSTSRRIVGDDPYWPISNGPKHVIVKNGGGIQMNVARTVSGKFACGEGGITNGNNLTFSDTLQINVSGYITGSPTYNGNATLVYNTGFLYDVWNEWTGTGSVGVGVPKNVLINLNTSLSMRDGNHGIPGNLTISGGTLALNNLSGDLYVGGNWINNGTFTANSRTVIFNSTSGGNILSGAMSGSNKFYNLTFNGGGGDWTLQNNMEVGNNLTINSGTLDADSQNIALGGNWLNNGTFLSNGSTVTFNGTGSQSISKTGGELFHHLIMNKSLGTLTLNNNVLTHDLTLTSGVLADGGNLITVNGNVDNTATHSGAGKIKLSGGSAGHILSGSGLFGNLELDDINNASITGTVIINGSLTLTNGTLNLGTGALTLNGPAIAGIPSNLTTTNSSNLAFGGASAGIYIPGSVTALNNLSINNANGITLSSDPTIFGTLSLINGALRIGTHTLTLNGAVALTSGGFTGGNTSNITFGGSGAATLLPTVTLRDLTINRVSGIDLNGNVTINNSLTISNGNLRTGSNTVTLGASGALSEAPGATVVGNISTQRNITAATGTEYFGNIGSDIEMHGTALGITTVLRKTGTASTGNGHNSIQRYFIITPASNSSLNADLVFHYDINELNGQDPSTLKLYESIDNGSTWSNHGGVVNIGARTVSLSGIDDFSRWTASNDDNSLGNTTTPSIVSINPVSTIVGETGLILTVYGNNFVKDSSTVKFDGNDRITTYINGTQLTAVIPASDLIAVGSFNITVFNSGGGGESNAMQFNVLDAPNAMLQGMVYNDVNSNGIKDSGEIGYPNWKIRLSGAEIDSMLTDTRGYYSFVVRHNGTYTITEELNDTCIQTQPAGLGYYTIPVTLGEIYDELNFGNANGFKYVGPGNGNWSDAGNWPSGQAPGPENAAIIPKDVIVTIDSLPNDSIRAMRILDGGKLQISSQIGTLKVSQDIQIDPGAILQLPDNSDSTSIICYKDWVNRGTFIPGQSTISLKGDKPKMIVSDGATNRFFNLSILGDSTATIGNVYINNIVRLERSITLGGQDSIIIENHDTASIQNDGKILNGTIKRNIKPGETSKYRFESTESYIKFFAGGENPSAVSVTTIPEFTPGNFYWDSVGGVPDPIKNTVVIDSLKHFSKWVFGIPRPKVSGSGIDSNHVRIEPLNRAYIISAEGGADNSAELGLRYEQNEVPEGIDEAALGLYSGPYFADSIRGRWNMISLPFLTEEKIKTNIFPTAISDAFTYDGIYVNKSSLSFGEGYWLRFPSDQQIIIKGEDQNYSEITVKEGWNLIGSISYPIAAASVTSVPWGMIQSEFFGFSTSYDIVDSLFPLKGYWIKMSSPGKLIISLERSGNFFKSSSYGPDQFSSIKITDASSNRQELLFGCNTMVDLRGYELPPLPPEGIFDVRYASGRILEIAEKQIKDCPIHMTSADYPIKIEWQLKVDSLKSSLIIGDKSVNMERIGAIEIKNPESQIKLRLYPVLQLEIPREYSLEQNYPNPFNPSTTIRYQLPEESKVTLSIFNVLGQLVSKVVDCIEQAGTKSVEWKSVNVASGVYFYRLEAVSVSDPMNTSSQVRKMIILK